jgi:hypothetical protein
MWSEVFCVLSRDKGVTCDDRRSAFEAVYSEVVTVSRVGEKRRGSKFKHLRLLNSFPPEGAGGISSVQASQAPFLRRFLIFQAYQKECFGTLGKVSFSLNFDFPSPPRVSCPPGDERFALCGPGLGRLYAWRKEGEKFVGFLKKGSENQGSPSVKAQDFT